MLPNKTEWLPLDTAAKRFGYAFRESFSRRLRQLRKLGYIVDIGRPPTSYPLGNSTNIEKIVIMWPNPKTALIRSDAPSELLDPKRGRRSQYKKRLQK